MRRSSRGAYAFSVLFIAIGIVVALVYPLDATTSRRGLPIWLVSGVLVFGGLFLFLHTLHSRRDKGDPGR